MCSHVVINELLTYTLFCQELQPDYIIAHDGTNDFFCGMISDPYLLNEHNLTYQHEMEDWSHLLHKTEHISKTQTNIPFEVNNLTMNCIKAYVERKLQFQTTAELQGSTFIWGLQPLVYSKQSMSIEEIMYFEDIKTLKDPYLHQRKQIQFLYDYFENNVNLPDRVTLLNFNKYFKRYDENLTLFQDFVHTNPMGDEIISQYYFNFFKNNYLRSDIKNI